MTKNTPAAVAPRLPATSVDFNALNDACAKGDDAAAAFAEKVRHDHRKRPEEAPAEPAPRAEPPSPAAPQA